MATGNVGQKMWRWTCGFEKCELTDMVITILCTTEWGEVMTLAVLSAVCTLG